MTEKEKVKAGMLYNANFDSELVNERNVCKEKCYKHNILPPSETDKRTEIIKDLLGKTGK